MKTATSSISPASFERLSRKRPAIPAMGLMAFSLLFLFPVACSPAAPVQEPAAQWIVVTAPSFGPAIEPLVQHRAAEGFHTRVITTTDVLTPAEIARGDADKLRDRLLALCRETQGTSYILLFGAVHASNAEQALASVVPTLSGTVGRMKNQPSDNGFGCLGGDLQPEVAVGRFPACAPRARLAIWYPGPLRLSGMADSRPAPGYHTAGRKSRRQFRCGACAGQLVCPQHLPGHH